MLGKYSTTWVMSPARVSLIFKIALSFCPVFLLKVKFPWLEICSGPLRIIQIENQDTDFGVLIRLGPRQGSVSDPLWVWEGLLLHLAFVSQELFPFLSSQNFHFQDPNLTSAEACGLRTQGRCSCLELAPFCLPLGNRRWLLPTRWRRLGLGRFTPILHCSALKPSRESHQGPKSPLLSWACLKVDCQELFPEFF